MPMASMATAAATIARKNPWARAALVEWLALVALVAQLVLVVLVAMVEWLARAVLVDRVAIRQRPRATAAAVRLARAMGPKHRRQSFCSA